MKILLFLCLAVQTTLATFAQQGISGEAFLKDDAYLASDKLEGRFPGTKGNELAAKYIVKKFKQAGLLKVNGSYYQPFDVVIKLLPAENNFVHFSGNKNHLFNKEYSLFSFSGSGNVDAPLIWIGSDSALLKTSSIQNKWVVLWRSKKAGDYDMAKQAAANGAAGVIYITPDSMDKKDVLIRLRPGAKEKLSIPVIHIKRNIWDANWEKYFPDTTVCSVEAIGKISTEHFTASVQITPQKVHANNIVGLIEGSDPELKNEYIVIGAHYDHLGWGGYGTGSLKPDTIAIHNGADDNASGTSALLQIAKELAKNKDALKRSILIVAFSAEEAGLLGSVYFADHLPVAQQAVKVMINMDMVGRLNDKQELYMGGAGTFPGGVDLMKQLGEGSGLHPVVHAGGIGGSDHVSFYKKGISVIGLHTGGHPQYHTPEDDSNLINKSGAELVCKYIYNAVVALANRTEAFAFIRQDQDD